MDAYFTELGRTVLKRWKDANFSLERFPGIACAALAGKPPGGRVDPAAFIRDFLLDDEQPAQTHSGFGQPELVVFDHPRFYIQVLFWLDGTTQIHQHAFSGAFHVLAGSSIHSEFVFENQRAVSASFRVGDIRLKKTEYLPTGATRAIISGPAHIHSLFHLETPSLTLVIRTHNDPGAGPQFTYLPPHAAVDPFHGDALTTRRTQLLDVLEKLDDPAYPDLVREMIGELDFERGFFILQNGLGHLRALGAWDEVWRAFRKKHRALARYAAPTLDEIVWRDGLTGLRGSVTDVEHRYFLALLLNVPSRAAILSLVAKSHPGTPAAATVLRWLEELSDASEISTWILDAEFPAELDIPAAGQKEAFLAALRHFLTPNQRTLRQCGLSAKALATLRDTLAGSSLRALVS